MAKLCMHRACVHIHAYVFNPLTRRIKVVDDRQMSLEGNERSEVITIKKNTQYIDPISFINKVDVNEYLMVYMLDYFGFLILCRSCVA